MWIQFCMLLLSTLIMSMSLAEKTRLIYILFFSDYRAEVGKISHVVTLYFRLSHFPASVATTQHCYYSSKTKLQVRESCNQPVIIKILSRTCTFGGTYNTTLKWHNTIDFYYIQWRAGFLTRLYMLMGKNAPSLPKGF